MAKMSEYLVKNDKFITKYVNETCNGVLNLKTALCTLILTITDDCNMKCKHCPRGNGYIHPDWLPVHMSLETVKLLCNQLGKDFVGRFSICGIGEPTLHPQLKEIILLINEMCPQSYIFMITNGNELTEEIVQMPMLKRIEISVYSEESKNFNEKRWENYNKVNIRTQYPGHMLTKFNNRAGNVWSITSEEVPDTICYMPFYQITMDTDGECYPCSCDWKREDPLGNIHNQNVYDIFTNNFKNIRVKLLEHKRLELPLCGKCSGKGNIAHQFIDFWRKYYNEEIQ